MMNLRMTQESVRVDEPFYLPTCRREKAAGRFQHRRVIVEQPDRGSRFSHQSLTKFFFSSRRRHTRSVSAFLLNRSSDLRSGLICLARSSRTGLDMSHILFMVEILL